MVKTLASTYSLYRYFGAKVYNIYIYIYIYHYIYMYICLFWVHGPLGRSFGALRIRDGKAYARITCSWARLAKLLGKLLSLLIIAVCLYWFDKFRVVILINSVGNSHSGCFLLLLLNLMNTSVLRSAETTSSFDSGRRVSTQPLLSPFPPLFPFLKSEVLRWEEVFIFLA